MRKNWTNVEVKEIVNDYFRMLKAEINNISFNKSEHWKNLKPKINNRSKGSIEFKHQNISAILVKYGMPYIVGYKPRGNYQKALEVEVLEYLASQENIEKYFDLFSSDSKIRSDEKQSFGDWKVAPPESSFFKEKEKSFTPKISKINYLEKEQNNRKLGMLGEELVFNYEKWRLIQSDKEHLAAKVEWVSNDQGDGAGFDILSRNVNGADRYIEVKTTKLGIKTPIFFSRNELKFSRNHSKEYHVYRLFQFGKKTKMFSKNGSLAEICHARPTHYIGEF